MNEMGLLNGWMEGGVIEKIKEIYTFCLSVCLLVCLFVTTWVIFFVRPHFTLEKVFYFGNPTIRENTRNNYCSMYLDQTLLNRMIRSNLGDITGTTLRPLAPVVLKLRTQVMKYKESKFIRLHFRNLKHFFLLRNFSIKRVIIKNILILREINFSWP